MRRKIIAGLLAVLLAVNSFGAVPVKASSQGEQSSVPEE